MKDNTKTTILKSESISSDIYQELFANLTEGFAFCEIICDKKNKPIDYRYLLINPAFETITGMKAKSTIGKTIKEIYPDIEQKWIDFYGAVAQTQKPATIEEYNHNTSRYYNVRSFSSEKGKFVMLFSDITERKLVEEEIKQVSQIVENSLNEIFSFDSETLRFSNVNRGALLNIGYTIDELKKMTPIDIKPNITYKEFEKLVEPLRKREKEKIVFETVHKRKDKSLYDVEVHLQLSKYDKNSIFTAFILDITERKQANEEMQKLAAVVKYSSELVNLSTLDGKMTFLNESGGKMLGIDPHKIENMNIMDVIPDHLKGLVKRELLPAMMKEGIWEGDLQYRNMKTNEITDVHATTFTIKDTDTGEPQFLANVSLDITERKQAEDELKKHRDNLEKLVSERTQELEDKNKELDMALKVFVGRELTIRNLEEQIKSLEEQNISPK